METTAGNIFLIGFMGTGKSTVSALLSRKFGFDTMEMDEAIAVQEGMSIPEIFQERGEAYFRERETMLLRSLNGRRNMVVSCGGGTPLRHCNVEVMRENGRIIWLTAKPETILERVRDDHSRPLLEDHKDAVYISSMIKEREPRYRSAADIVIATDGLETEEICDRIIKKVKEMDGGLC